MTDIKQCQQCHAASVPLKKCSTCQTSYYCSVTCQSAAWPMHKTECKSLLASKALSLITAIKDKDLEAIKRLTGNKKLIDMRVDYTYTRDDGRSVTLKKWSAIHQCVSSQNVDCLKQLIDRIIYLSFLKKKVGANIDLKDGDGETPLFVASGNCPVSIVRLLLEKGANPNVKSKDGWTPLMMAVRDTLYENVAALLENGASIYFGRDMFGRTVMDMKTMNRGVRVMNGQSMEEAEAMNEVNRKRTNEILELYV